MQDRGDDRGEDRKRDDRRREDRRREERREDRRGEGEDGQKLRSADLQSHSDCRQSKEAQENDPDSHIDA
jgi:hypothetical protein